MVVGRVFRSSSEFTGTLCQSKRHSRFDAGRAQPVELGGVEARFFHAEQWRQRRAVLNESDHAAVARGGAEQIIHGNQAAGAWHVLHHDRRIAGNMSADIAADRSGEGVVAAAGAAADDECNGFAFVELVDRRRLMRQRPTP